MRLRIGLTCLALVLASTVFVPSPILPIWIVTLLVTEWAHWLSLATLTLLIWSLRKDHGFSRIGVVVGCLVSTTLFLTPLIEACLLSRDLPKGLSAAFGESPEESESFPIRFARLWVPFPQRSLREKVLQFPTNDGSLLNLDFFADSTPGQRPCIVILHGGSWRSGDENQFSFWSSILAKKGYRVASIAYRLAPKSVWPAQKQDVLAALTYLKSNAALLGIDPTQFVLLGRSSGAQIVLATAYSIPDPAVRGCVACYPPTDMNFDYGPGAAHSLLDAHSLLEQFLGGTPESAPANYHDASPLQLVGPDSPPTLIEHGTRDEIVWIENSRKLRDALANQHRPVYLLELPWATHGFDINPSGPGGQLQLFAVDWFLQSVFKISPNSNP